jgi:NDP-sugar pyrophosphorylase family protein
MMASYRQSTRVEEGAIIAPDAVIGPGARVLPGARVTKVVVWPDAVASGEVTGTAITVGSQVPGGAAETDGRQPSPAPRQVKLSQQSCPS